MSVFGDDNDSQYAPFDNLSGLELPLRDNVSTFGTNMSGYSRPPLSAVDSAFDDRTSGFNSTTSIETLPLRDLLRNPHVRALYEQSARSSQWQQMEIEDLLQNPNVKKLFRDYTEAVKSLDRNAKAREELSTEVFQLAKKCHALEEKSLAGASIDVPLRVSSSLLSHKGSNDSLAPSDSVSQRGGGTSSTHGPSFIPPPTSTGFPALRPEIYPESILWSYNDCLKDPKAKPPPGNASRPHMNKAIQQQDGSCISDADWRLIVRSAKSIFTTLLLPLESTSPNSTGEQANSLRWYQRYHNDKVVEAILELERQHPLVGLCALHWKAEHILRRTAQSHLNTASRNLKAKGNPSPAATSKTTSSANPPPAPSNGPTAVATASSDPSSSEPVKETQAAGSAAKRKLSIAGQDTAPGGSANKRAKPQPRIISQNTQSSYKHLLTHSFGSNRPSQTRKAAANSSESSQGFSQSNSESTSTSPLTSSNGPSELAPEARSTGAVDPAKVDIPLDLSELYTLVTSEFPTYKDAISFLEECKLDPTYSVGDPSDNMLLWLNHIESADPNNPALDENDTDSQWGHQQYSGGSLSSTSVLTSWEAVGNVDTALRLLRAVIKTSKVARLLCAVHGVKATSFLSDMYLDSISSRLLRFWVDSRSKSSTTAAKDSTPDQVKPPSADSSTPEPPASPTVPPPSNPPAPESESLSKSEPPGASPSLTKEQLNLLSVPKLKNLLGQIPIEGKRPTTKGPIIEAILSANPSYWPSKSELDALTQEKRRRVDRGANGS